MYNLKVIVRVAKPYPMLLPRAWSAATTELVPVTLLTVEGKLTVKPLPSFQVVGAALVKYDVKSAVVPLASPRVITEMLLPVIALH